MWLNVVQRRGTRRGSISLSLRNMSAWHFVVRNPVLLTRRDLYRSEPPFERFTTCPQFVLPRSGVDSLLHVT